MGSEPTCGIAEITLPTEPLPPLLTAHCGHSLQLHKLNRKFKKRSLKFRPN
jgi:hypothetical protein